MKLSATRVRGGTRLAIPSLVGVLLLVGAVQLAPRVFGNAIPEAQVEAAALAAIRQETAALSASNEFAVRQIYTGKALASELALRSHVMGLIAAGTDYPGEVQLSNVKILDSYGNSGAVTVDIALHEKLANMKRGSVQDYSESDLIYHVILVSDQGAWKVTDMSSTFAPGAEP